MTADIQKTWIYQTQTLDEENRERHGCDFSLRSQIVDSASSPRIAASPKARHVYVL
jgi:hypothetical protein